MRLVYAAVIFCIFVWLALSEIEPFSSPSQVVETLAREAGVPNSVAGILLRNRLYDTVFEVFVFTIAVLGVQHYLSRHDPEETVIYISEDTPVILARVGAMISGLVFLELSIRGHLGPGGGFAAGVAGGTAIGLVAVTSDPGVLRKRYERWHVSIWEKASVIVFLLLSGATFFGPKLPQGTFGTLISGGAIPWLNMLIALKVAIGSWTIVLLFIRYRGLL